MGAAKAIIRMLRVRESVATRRRVKDNYFRKARHRKTAEGVDC